MVHSYCGFAGNSLLSINKRIDYCHNPFLENDYLVYMNPVINNSYPHL